MQKRENDQCRVNISKTIKFKCICEREKQDARSQNRLQSQGLVNAVVDGLSGEIINRSTDKIAIGGPALTHWPRCGIVS